MRHTLILLILMVLLGLGLPATASEKCSSDAQECLNYMVTELKGRGWVGLELDEDEATGILRVSHVVPGSPAEAGGFKIGDELVAFNSIAMNQKNSESLEKARQSMSPGQAVTYTVVRGGRNREVSVTLAELPPEVLAQWVGSHMLEHSTVGIARN